MASYFEEPDASGHEFGPDSDKVHVLHVDMISLAYTDIWYICYTIINVVYDIHTPVYITLACVCVYTCTCRLLTDLLLVLSL